MGRTTPLVLLVGRDLVSSSHLRERLQYWDCEFHLAATYAEALGLLNRCRFDLVLSETGLPDGRASRLIPWLLGAPTSLFLSFPVDGTCWWLPAVDHGRQCWGSHALRPSEFARVLDKLLYQLVSEAGPEPRSTARPLLHCAPPSTPATSKRVPGRADAMDEI
jgi:hypothetical protein